MNARDLIASFNPMDGCKGGPGDRRLSARVVRTRKEHRCPGNAPDEAHTVPLGSLMVVNVWIIDREFVVMRCCEECVTRWAVESGMVSR